MSLLLGPMRQHIPGFKEMTEHKGVIEVKPGKQVFIPLYASMHGIAPDLRVSPSCVTEM